MNSSALHNAPYQREYKFVPYPVNELESDLHLDKFQKELILKYNDKITKVYSFDKAIEILNSIFGQEGLKEIPITPITFDEKLPTMPNVCMVGSLSHIQFGINEKGCVSITLLELVAYYYEYLEIGIERWLKEYAIIHSPHTQLFEKWFNYALEKYSYIL